MANAKKLPSGAWRTLASKTVGGQKIRKSFTVHPDQVGGDSRRAKDRSELLAREWCLSNHRSAVHGATVKEAIEQYIKDKDRVLSPSTIRGYGFVLAALSPIWDICISDLETPQIQRLINDWSMVLTTKTIRNRITLLLAVLDYNGIDKKFKVRYPQNNSKKVVSPDVEDVQMLLRNATGDLIPIIYLTAFGSLRRGEVAGLREMDISRDMHTVTISGDMVLGADGWTYKPFPKTQGSIRTVQLPKFIIDSIPCKEHPKDFIFTMTPAAMTDRFRRLAAKLQLPYTLHSLRHFAASFRSDIGIPKKYIQEVGGWVDGSNSVLDRVYDNTMDSSRKKYTQIANRFIEDNFRADVVCTS